MNFKKGVLLISLLTIGFFQTIAQVKVARIFGDNMILQQDSQIPIWGWAKKGDKITISLSWADSPITVKTDKKGQWKTEITTLPASFTPHTITIKGNNTIEIQNILFGEVWIASGQSNMEMPVKGFKNQPVYGSNKLITESSNPYIRHFDVKLNFSNTPLEDCEGSWTQASPKTTPNYSAVAYVFSKMLNQALNIPIGIVNTTWGGTPAEAWTDQATLTTQFPEIDQSILKTEDFNYQSPTTLYNAMINPVLGFKMKGVIWYQGESNVVRPEQYSKLFPAMINCWRKNWEQGDFPFYFVQICPMQSYDNGNKRSYALREAQLNTMKAVKNTGMVATLDIGAQWGIHPPKKIEIGERLAYWALNKQYGFTEVQYGGPTYKSWEVLNNRALLEFEHAPLGISTFDQELTGFMIAGEDSVFYPAEARIKIEWDKPNQERRHLVEVWNDKVTKPIAVRYGWSNWISGHLYDTGGNPASSFRTDNWEE